MAEPVQLDVNKVLQKLQQKLNEANSQIVILESQVDVLTEQIQACTCNDDMAEKEDAPEERPAGKLIDRTFD